MGTVGGPRIQTSNLVLSIDPKNVESYQTDDPNILRPKLWTTGTGGVSGFGSDNGSASENHRIIGTDPYGNDAVIWEARPDSSSGADGGWNTNRFSIDNTKLYRFSVWVRRTVYDDGRFYFGTRGYGSTNGVLRRDSGNNTTNPYYWTSSDPPTTGQLPQNEWVLVVAHNWPAGSGTGAEHPDSGRYTVSAGRYGNINRDYVWRNETVEALHRSYLYYSTQTTPRQQWVYPRVDIVDGNEPSIDDLLNNRVNNANLIDRSGNGNTAVFINNPSVNTTDGGYIELNSSNQKIQYSNNNFTLGSSFTVSAWVYLLSSSNYTHVFSASSSQGDFSCKIGNSSNNAFSPYFYSTSGRTFANNNTLTTNNWYHLVYTYDGSFLGVYINGELYDSNTVSLNISNLDFQTNDAGGVSEYNNFRLGNLKVYNKGFTEQEVIDDFNSQKSRFGM